MEKKQYVFPIEKVLEKITHGGSVKCKIILDEESCGIKNFSFLVNTKVDPNVKTTFGRS